MNCNCKLEDIYTESLLKAIDYAKTISENDSYSKATAYAQIAIAAALQLNDNEKAIYQADSKETKKEEVEVVVENKEEAEKKTSNKKSTKTTNKNKTEIVQETVQEIKKEDENTFQVPFDKDGIPYLEPGDYLIQERYLMLEALMDSPEIKARLAEVNMKNGYNTLNDTEPQLQPQEPQVNEKIPQVSEDTPVEAEKLNIQTTEEDIEEFTMYQNLNGAYLNSIISNITNNKINDIELVETEYVNSIVQTLNKLSKEAINTLENLQNANPWYFDLDETGRSQFLYYINVIFYAVSEEDYLTKPFNTFDNVDPHTYIMLVDFVSQDIAWKTFNYYCTPESGVPSEIMLEALRIVNNNNDLDYDSFNQESYLNSNNICALIKEVIERLNRQ